MRHPRGAVGRGGANTRAAGDARGRADDEPQCAEADSGAAARVPSRWSADGTIVSLILYSVLRLGFFVGAERLARFDPQSLL